MNPHEESEPPHHESKIKRRDRNKTVANTAKVYQHIKMKPGCMIADVIRDTKLPETNVRRYVPYLKAIGCVKELPNGRLMIDGYPPPDLLDGRDIEADLDDMGSYLSKGYSLKQVADKKVILAKPSWIPHLISRFINQLPNINVEQNQVYILNRGYGVITVPYNGEDLLVEADPRFPILRECLNPATLKQWKQFKKGVKERRDVKDLKIQLDEIRLQLQNTYSLLKGKSGSV